MLVKSAYRIGKCLALLLIISHTVGCARTYQAHWAKPSGFLDDYSKLSGGGSDDAILSYWNEETNWQRYDKIIFEPIAIWTGEESQLNELPHAERYRFKELLESQMRESLKKDFRLVRRPTANTLRVQLAITEAQTSVPLLDFYSVFYPTARALSELQMIVLGTESWVGTASYEGMITDAETGELLMASVDRRTGAKTLEGSFDIWDDVESAYKHWVTQFTYQLCQKRQRPDCQEPGWFWN